MEQIAGHEDCRVAGRKKYRGTSVLFETRAGQRRRIAQVFYFCFIMDH